MVGLRLSPDDPGVATDAVPASAVLAQAEAAWSTNDAPEAMTLLRPGRRPGRGHRRPGRLLVEAVLGLARGQQYNLTPGVLPVRLRAAYDAAPDPSDRARLGAALARCWAYANEPARAQPFASEALARADGGRRPGRCWPMPWTLRWHRGGDPMTCDRRREWAIAARRRRRTPS